MATKLCMYFNVTLLIGTKYCFKIDENNVSTIEMLFILHIFICAFLRP
jgi:hypothetical protein